MVTTRPSLLERIRDGEQDAWREFEALYNPLLVGVCKRSGLSDADTSDVVQETLMGVHQTFAALEGQFDRSKRRFRDWLRRVTKNVQT